MGKIANALGKYAQERQAARLPKLTRADRVALISYNSKTGHLLNPDTATGKPGSHSMEALKNSGTLQRLLDHKLIFPGGKLTPKGLAECERLKKLNRVRKPAVDADIKIKEKIIADIDIDDVVIELEEEVEPVEAAGVVEAAPKKVVHLLKQPAAIKPLPAPQPEDQEAPATAPPVEVAVVEDGKQAVVSTENNRAAALPAIPEKPQDNETEGD